jgi:hypothetical protein
MYGHRNGSPNGGRTLETCSGKVSVEFSAFRDDVLIPFYRPEQRKLNIMIGDFVKAELPYFDVCISNTPYQVRICTADLCTLVL